MGEVFARRDPTERRIEMAKAGSPQVSDG